MFRFLVLCQFVLFCKQEGIPAGHLQPLGSHRAPEGVIKSAQDVPSPRTFYNYHILTGQPVIFKGAANLSPGFNLWTDSYLREKYGDVVVRVDYGKKENRARAADNMPLKEFLAIYNDSDRYLVDTLPEEMWDEFVLPSCLLCGGFTSRLQDAVMWFSSGGSKSFLHMDTVDNINCMISGVKDWFIVDLEHSRLIDMDHGEGDYCSVNVDKVDMFKYPSLQNLPWWSARLEPGDCIFVPHGWAHQVTASFRNIAVNIWWTPLSRFNSTDCEVKSGSISPSEAKLSNFQFTPGEQSRFMVLQVIKIHGGAISFDLINRLVVGEQTAERLITQERFALLDTDQDGQLTEDELMSVTADLVDEALGRTPPGEIFHKNLKLAFFENQLQKNEHHGKINIRGESRHLDQDIEALLESIEKQPPFVEEFLLREDKTLEDYQSFLAEHSHELDETVNEFIQNRMNQEIKRESAHQHLEL